MLSVARFVDRFIGLLWGTEVSLNDIRLATCRRTILIFRAPRQPPGGIDYQRVVVWLNPDETVREIIFG